MLKNSSEIVTNDLDNPWYITTKPSENRQNISLRYGVALVLKSNTLPKLSTINNEVPGEVENPMWMPLDDVNKYQWAFNHDQVIFDYIKKITKK